MPSHAQRRCMEQEPQVPCLMHDEAGVHCSNTYNYEYGIPPVSIDVSEGGDVGG